MEVDSAICRRVSGTVPARCRWLATKQAARQLRPPDFESSRHNLAARRGQRRPRSLPSTPIIVKLLSRASGTLLSTLSLFALSPSSSSSFSCSFVLSMGFTRCFLPFQRRVPILFSYFIFVSTTRKALFSPKDSILRSNDSIESFVDPAVGMIHCFSPVDYSPRTKPPREREVISCVSIYTNVTSIAEFAIIIFRWCRLNTDDNHIGTMAGQAY